VSALGRDGTVAFKGPNDQIAADIARSIEPKRVTIDNRTILALDAGISGGSMFERGCRLTLEVRCCGCQHARA
jgi:hypothetical protein